MGLFSSHVYCIVEMELHHEREIWDIELYTDEFAIEVSVTQQLGYN